MIAVRHGTVFMLAMVAAMGSRGASGQAVDYQDINGVRYQITRQVIPRQMPVTEMREQQQSVYRQQVTTETVQHQQLYTVPVTQYQIVSRLHGRWNPLVTPYWTHHYEPVTVWQQQVANVQIPVSRVAWAPETRTVQTPVTTYRTVEDTVERRVAIGPAPGGGNTAMASTARPLSSAAGSSTSGASATIAALPPSSSAAPSASRYSSGPIGGEKMTSDPPREATGWQPSGQRR